MKIVPLATNRITGRRILTARLSGSGRETRGVLFHFEEVPEDLVELEDIEKYLDDKSRCATSADQWGPDYFQKS